MTDIREKLKKLRTPVVLYGTGDGADRLIDDLNKLGVAVSGVFASDGFVRERMFRGFKVESFDSLYRRFPDMTVLMCFGSDREEVLENIERISSAVPLFFPEYPVYGDNIFNSEFAKLHRTELEFVRSRLADELSVKTFDCIVKFRITGEPKYLFDCESEDEPIPRLPNNTVFADFGAYNGDTVKKFVGNNPDYSRIIAVEPDTRNYRKLCENTAGFKNVRCINAAVGSFGGEVSVESKKGRGTHAAADGAHAAVCVTADMILCREVDPILMKVDVEGSEADFIRGALQVIADKRPQIRMACYHRSEDIFALPVSILALRDDYRIFLRHKSGVPSWNTEYFFV